MLGRDWIHQTNYIMSSLYQVIIFWDGKLVVIHLVSNQQFKANMIQACYFDDQVGYITLQGSNEEGWSIRISVQKVIEVGVQNVHQDSTRLGLADLIASPDV